MLTWNGWLDFFVSSFVDFVNGLFGCFSLLILMSPFFYFTDKSDYYERERNCFLFYIKWFLFFFLVCFSAAQKPVENSCSVPGILMLRSLFN